MTQDLAPLIAQIRSNNLALKELEEAKVEYQEQGQRMAERGRKLADRQRLLEKTFELVVNEDLPLVVAKMRAQEEVANTHIKLSNFLWNDGFKLTKAPTYWQRTLRKLFVKLGGK